MHWIKVQRFVKTILSTLAVAGSLTDHAHQVIGRWRDAFDPQVVLAGGHGVIKAALVGQDRGLIQQRRFGDFARPAPLHGLRYRSGSRVLAVLLQSAC